MVVIAGKDKADVLIALYAAAKATGSGVRKTSAVEDGVEVERATFEPGELSRDEAIRLVEGSGGKFEAVNFVPLHVDLRGDEFDPTDYDLLYGDGSALAAVEQAGLGEQT